MPKFDVDKYHAELNKLAEHVCNMNIAVQNMHYECGEEGVSLRATSYLQDFLDAKEAVTKQQAEVSKAMLPGMKS